MTSCILTSTTNIVFMTLIRDITRCENMFQNTINTMAKMRMSKFNRGSGRLVTIGRI